MPAYILNMGQDESFIGFYPSAEEINPHHIKDVLWKIEGLFFVHRIGCVMLRSGVLTFVIINDVSSYHANFKKFSCFY